MFICFANFYQLFIKDFSLYALPLTFLLKITKSSEKSALKAFKTDNNKIVDNSSSKVNKMVENLSKNNKSKKLTYKLNIKTIK